MLRKKEIWRVEQMKAQLFEICYPKSSYKAIIAISSFYLQTIIGHQNQNLPVDSLPYDC